MMKDFKKTIRTIGFHGRVLLKGFVRMLYGVVMATMIGVGVYGFAMVPNEGGYVAVRGFLLATIMVILGFLGVYFMGGHCKKGVAR